MHLKLIVCSYCYAAVLLLMYYHCYCSSVMIRLFVLFVKETLLDNGLLLMGQGCCLISGEQVGIEATTTTLL